MTGMLGILNVGAGDTKLTFDPNNQEDMARAARVVTDMLRRGFALFVEVGENERGPLYQRVHKFDEATCEYIIMDSVPATDSEVEDHDRGKQSGRKAKGEGAGTKGSSRRGGRTAERRIPASEAAGVAVARVAGG